MSALVLNTALPAAYEALAQALNITSLIPKDPLSLLESLQFDGKAAKAWIQSLPGNFSLVEQSSTWKVASRQIRQLPNTFPEAVYAHSNTMILASCFFGTSFVLETTLKHLPLVNRINPYLRKAAALAGGGVATVLAAHNYLEIETDALQVFDLALRVSVVAFGSKVFIRTSQKSLRALGESSAIIAKVVSAFSNGIAGGLDFLVFPATTKEEPPAPKPTAPSPKPASPKTPTPPPPEAAKDTSTVSDDEE